MPDLKKGIKREKRSGNAFSRLEKSDVTGKLVETDPFYQKKRTKKQLDKPFKHLVKDPKTGKLEEKK